MKKAGFVWFVFLFLSCIFSYSFVHAADYNEVSGSLNSNLEQVKNFTDVDKWQYIGQQWKEVILKNQYLAPVDSFLRSINPVFLVLFGQNYDISLTLLFVILLWIFFFISFGIIISSFSTFNKGISFILSFAIAVLAANIGIYKQLSLFLFKAIFYKEGIWSWIGLVIFFVVYLLILTLLKKFVMGAAGYFKKKSKMKREKQEKQDQEILRETAEDIKEGLE